VILVRGKQQIWMMTMELGEERAWNFASSTLVVDFEVTLDV